MYLSGEGCGCPDNLGMYTRLPASAQGRANWQNLQPIPPGEQPEAEYLGDYLGGAGLRDYLGAPVYDYLGQSGETPWWENLILTGERIATGIVQQRTPGFTPPTIYGTTPPMFPTSYPGGGYIPPASPGPIAAPTTNWLPYLLAGGLALYLLTR